MATQPPRSTHRTDTEATTAVYMPTTPSGEAGVVERVVTTLFRRRGWIPADELLSRR